MQVKRHGHCHYAICTAKTLLLQWQWQLISDRAMINYSYITTRYLNISIWHGSCIAVITFNPNYPIMTACTSCACSSVYPMDLTRRQRLMATAGAESCTT
jgi:hypothetical protein